MALRFLSGSDGFIPEATGQVIAFVRKESDFSLNKYVQYVPTPQPVGVYTKLERDEFVRITSDASYAWEDGDEAPKGDAHQIRFDTVEFRTERRAYPWTLGYQAIDTTTLWKPKLAHAAAAISKAMTNRSNRVATLLTTAGNWGSHTAAATTLNGGAGTWVTASDDPASPNFEAIYKSLIEATRRIHLATNGRIKQSDLKLVVGPDLAIKMSQAPEIINYVRETPQALTIIKEGLSTDASLWGLPATYRGFALVVEDSPIVTESPKASGTEATTARTYVWPTDKAALVSRVGGMDGEYGSPSWSTVQLYHYKGLMAIEAFDDPENKRVKGRAVENIKEVLASSVAGFLITSAA